MVSGSRVENLPAGVRKTIQSIKEIVGNHSDADIYSTLKETNMDPNETTQKLLNQDTFHEVKRKRDKKNEVIPAKEPVPIKPRKPTEQLAQVMKTNSYSDRNPRRAGPIGYVRNNISGTVDARVSRQFRVVRDNRNQNANKDIKPPAKSSVAASNKEPLTSNAPAKSSIEPSKNLKSLPNLPFESLSKPVKVTKTHETQQSSVTSPNSSVIGVYSSSSDPVHIPSPAYRPAANVGAIKREVGPVRVRRHITEISSKLSSAQQPTSVSNSKEQFRSFPIVSKSDQRSQSNMSESVPTISAGRSLNNHYRSRPHQQAVNHQKALQAHKEWKPKSSQKLNVTQVGDIGTPKSPVTARLQAKLPQAAVHEDQNVIIASHIRVSEVDRCRLTFGSLGIDVASSQNSGYQEGSRLVEESHIADDSLPANSPDSSGDGPKQVKSVDELAQSSGSISSASEPQSTERLESSSPQNMENYTNIGLVRQSSSPLYPPTEPRQNQQQQGPSELPSFSAYDPHTGFDMSYFRPATDESLRGQMLQIPQEGFSSHVGNNIPATSIAMIQQQQGQMYPQVHLLPYRQFLSPVFVPPMVMPGYSPHPSTGSSYMLMPGINSPHVNVNVNANGLKYAIPQYKAATPTGFPGVVGSDDSSRIKLKDGNMNVYLPNPQAETCEVWMNPREMQQQSYYKMGGETAYMQSPTAPALFNPSPQSPHMQFSGMYHPTPIANPHHLGVGVTPGYQQQQQHQSWTGNF